MKNLKLKKLIQFLFKRSAWCPSCCLFTRCYCNWKLHIFFLDISVFSAHNTWAVTEHLFPAVLWKDFFPAHSYSMSTPQAVFAPFYVLCLTVSISAHRAVSWSRWHWPLCGEKPLLPGSTSAQVRRKYWALCHPGTELHNILYLFSLLNLLKLIERESWYSLFTGLL